jgi:hypothetical protein
MKENEALSARLGEMNRALVVEESQAARWRQVVTALQEAMRQMRATRVWRLAKAVRLVKDD